MITLRSLYYRVPSFGLGSGSPTGFCIDHCTFLFSSFKEKKKQKRNKSSKTRAFCLTFITVSTHLLFLQTIQLVYEYIPYPRHAFRFFVFCLVLSFSFFRIDFIFIMIYPFIP